MSALNPATNPFGNFIKQRWALAALVIAAALVVLGALALSGTPPLQVLSDLVKSSLGGARPLTGTFRELTPLLISGIAVFLALKAGLFNIGVEGQFTVGGLACAMVALKIPGIAGIVAGIVAGMVFGALWALPAGLIKAYKGGHEVITTIMLNNVAMLLTTALVAGPWKAPNDQSPTTTSLEQASFLPNLIGPKNIPGSAGLFEVGELQVSSGLLIGLIVAIALWYWLKRTVAGYELQAVGANPTAARFAGIDHRRVTVKAMVWSGAIGGLAGAVQVLAVEHRFYPQLASGYGFDALGVAMLAGATPLGLIPSGFLFAVLNKGGTSIQVLDQVPKGITYVILGLLIIIAAAVRYRKTAGSNG